ncbi:MAG: hypothetical protein IPJ41_08915 [Phycisphaerales bacterium]|nr:hypothetical protein [Phycisphaerales bacterium]
MMPPALMLAATTHPPEVRHAVGRASLGLLVLILGAVVILCALALIAMRRRARAQDEALAHASGPSDRRDAWSEAAKRVALEEDDDIPREPGSA